MIYRISLSKFITQNKRAPRYDELLDLTRNTYDPIADIDDYFNICILINVAPNKLVCRYSIKKIAKTTRYIYNNSYPTTLITKRHCHLDRAIYNNKFSIIKKMYMKSPESFRITIFKRVIHLSNNYTFIKWVIQKTLATIKDYRIDLIKFIVGYNTPCLIDYIQMEYIDELSYYHDVISHVKSRRILVKLASKLRPVNKTSNYSISLYIARNTYLSPYTKCKVIDYFLKKY